MPFVTLVIITNSLLFNSFFVNVTNQVNQAIAFSSIYTREFSAIYDVQQLSTQNRVNISKENNKKNVYYQQRSTSELIKRANEKLLKSRNLRIARERKIFVINREGFAFIDQLSLLNILISFFSEPDLLLVCFARFPMTCIIYTFSALSIDRRVLRRVQTDGDGEGEC